MGKPLRLLIVEDSEEDANLLAHELRHGGFEVSARRVENPSALREALAEQEWDLVASDHVAGRLEGLQALAIVRERDERVPFVFVSGTVGEEYAVAAIKAGAADYILKGQMRRLVPAVDRELALSAALRERNAAEAEEAASREEALEHRIEERTAELARSNQELEWFAYAAAHDLNEPLRTVASYAELLSERLRHQVGDDPETSELLAVTLAGTRRMQELVRDLLASARRGASAVETCVDCDRALTIALDNLRLAIEETGAVVTHDTLPALAAEETAIVSIFQTLIENALKFRREVPPEVHVGVRAEPTRWVFAVSDNGIGFRQGRGTERNGGGLGLARCRRIVESHGGRIWVESPPGDGSTFYFSIPRWPAANRISSFASKRA
jgi:signal transduction histidine kinase